MATRPTNLTVVSQTPVTSYRASAMPAQLRRLHLCRVQPAAAIPFEERFPLNNGEFWGYAFSLPESEIYFYQLKAGESFGPLTPRITLTCSDWAVLTLIATPEIQFARTENQGSAHPDLSGFQRSVCVSTIQSAPGL